MVEASLSPRCASFVARAAGSEGADAQVLVAALVGQGLSTTHALANSYEDSDEMCQSLFPNGAQGDGTYKRACERILAAVSGAEEELCDGSAEPPERVVGSVQTAVPLAGSEGGCRGGHDGIATDHCRTISPPQRFNARTQPKSQFGCRADRSSVQSRSLAQVLVASRLVIPPFQRRYCWLEEQWATLLNDAIARPAHSLGRLTVYEVQAGMDCDSEASAAAAAADASPRPGRP